MPNVSDPFNQWLWAVGFIVISFLSGYFFQKKLYVFLEHIFAKTKNQLDDVLLLSVREHIPIWFILAGLAAAVRTVQLMPRWILFADRVIWGIFVLSVSWVIGSVLTRSLRLYAGRMELPTPGTSLTENLIRVTVVGLGVLVLLSNLGISIAPLLTALGVGSLAVALALQDTLSNLFAGFYILVSRQIQIGDYIKLDSNHEGYVLDIGWRATRIKELPGNLIIIPNAKLSQAIVTNYNGPDKDLAVLLQVGVAYGSDLSRVEQVTIEVARDVMREVEGGVPEFDPFIRFHTFGDSSINFTVILRAKEFVSQHLLKHEIIKRLHIRYQQEGIEIPFPQRVLHQMGAR